MRAAKPFVRRVFVGIGVPDAVLTAREDRFQKQVSHGIMRRLVQSHAAAKSLVRFLHERTAISPGWKWSRFAMSRFDNSSKARV